jgi:hypothetical protein
MDLASGLSLLFMGIASWGPDALDFSVMLPIFLLIASIVPFTLFHLKAKDGKDREVIGFGVKVLMFGAWSLRFEIRVFASGLWALGSRVPDNRCHGIKKVHGKRGP